MANESGDRDIGNCTTRAFIAIELPPEVKDLIAVHIERLKDVVAGGVKWVDPGVAHLTLAFLGNVPDTRLLLLSRILDALAVDSPSFMLSTGNLGAFPNAHRPRVLWLGLEGDTQLLSGLHSRLRKALQDEGLPTEKRAFKPHVTLGRARGKGAIPMKQNALNFQATSTLQFKAREIVLMSSVLTPRGPIHTPLHISPLARTAGTR